MTAPVNDDWPDPADLCRRLSDALAADDPAATGWAGELLVAVDRALGEQVAAVVGHDRFAALHAAWLGVALVANVAAVDLSVQPVEVQVCDASHADWIDAGDGWLHRLLYADPLDTRGGHPISLLVAGSAPMDAVGLSVIAERAICPVFASTESTGPFVTAVRERVALRPPLAADPTWGPWFDWPSVDGGPLLGAGAYAVAADAARSVLAHGWPFDVSDDAVARQLMATRVAQVVAVRCRAMAGRPAGEIANELADGLRGRYVGPRLPLRRVDVAVETVDGRLACTLRMSPRLGGNDPDDVPVTIRIELAAG